MILIIREDFESKLFILGTERDHLGKYYDVVAEVRVVVGVVLKETLTLRSIVSREEVFDTRLFKLSLLVFFFTPIIATIELTLFVE